MRKWYVASENLGLDEFGESKLFFFKSHAERYAKKVTQPLNKAHVLRRYW